MAAIRPTVTVYDAAGAVKTSVPLPAVFAAPIRRDVVHFVHTNIAKNARQAYSVNGEAGMQHSAESWGTGRAVSRIPRIGGGGTHRSGQGAFGNMCRKVCGLWVGCAASGWRAGPVLRAARGLCAACWRRRCWPTGRPIFDHPKTDRHALPARPPIIRAACSRRPRCGAAGTARST